MNASTRPELSIAVVQFAPLADRAANLEFIASAVERARQRGAELVVFPEYASYFEFPFGPAMIKGVEPLTGPFVTRLSEIADQTGCSIVAGMAEERNESTKFSNTVVAVAPGSGLVAKYRKLHLYDAFGDNESDMVIAGDIVDPELFLVGDWVVGLQTCYDIRFPEVSRRLVDAGAEILVVPAEWVRGPQKEHHWRTLTTARALENTVYLAAADHTPPIGVGCSLVVDPMGVTVASLGEEEGIAVAVASRDRLENTRRKNPALALRRFTTVEL